MDDIRILIVDDHPLMREALANGIHNEPGMTVIHQAQRGKEALALIDELHPDVVLLDLYMPGMDGIEVLQEISRQKLETRVIVLTSSHEDTNVLQAVRAGAHGYLLKEFTRDRILQAIRTVAAGQKYLPPEIAEKMANAVRTEAEAPIQLTKREEEVLDLLGEGLSDPKISVRLSISQSTVRVHIRNIILKLYLENRGEVVEYAVHRRMRRFGYQHIDR